MGQNTLHGDFLQGERDRCENPNLVLPLAFAIYENAELRVQAMAYFKANQQWDSIEEFAVWFGTKHQEYKWRSMAVLKWFSEYHFQ